MKFAKILRLNKSTDYEEMFRLWVELGSCKKASQEYLRRHPKADIDLGTVYLCSKIWMIGHPDEAVAIIKERQPNVPVDTIRAKIVEYALRRFKYAEQFYAWADEHPWVHDFKDMYEHFYGPRPVL